jgi:hypothetical protein
MWLDISIKNGGTTTDLLRLWLQHTYLAPKKNFKGLATPPGRSNSRRYLKNDY